MFNLETALAAWRNTLTYNRSFLPEDIDELERHLRDQVGDLTAQGMSQEDAFRQACNEIGGYGDVEAEYKKVHWETLRKRGRVVEEIEWRVSMVKNYFRVAARAVRRHPLYMILNIGGLAVGFAVTILIFLFVQHELAYDQFHDRANDIYRATSGSHSVSTSALLAPSLKQAFPQIESVTRLSPRFQNVLVTGESVTAYEEKFYFADSTFFDVLDFPMIKGNPMSALTASHSLVVTDRVARKYFGDSDPIGQVINIKGLWDAYDYTVTGVVADMQENSHLAFSMLASYTTRYSSEPGADKIDSWYHVGDLTYLKLHDGESVESVRSGMDQFVLNAMGERFKDRDKEFRSTVVQFQPVTDIHLYSDMDRELAAGSDPRYLYIFSIIAGFVLLIACINYINLATARSLIRAREVGVRKVVGANRRQLLGQFMAESAVVISIAALAAVGLVILLLPLFSNLVQKDLTLSSLLNVHVGLFVAGSLTSVGVLSGFYPALVLSGFQPNLVLKGQVTRAANNVRFRHVLVVTQFAASVVLVLGTIIIYQQLDFMQLAKLGLNPDQILVIDNRGALDSKTDDPFKEEILRHTSISSVSAMGGHLPLNNDNLGQLIVHEPEESWTPEDVSKILGFVSVDVNFLTTMEIELVNGRDFRLADLDIIRGKEFTPILVNERAVELHGWEEPLGQQFEGSFSPPPRIVGITKNFHVQSLQSEIKPMAFYPSWYSRMILVRVEATGVESAMEYMETTWKKHAPGRPLLLSFMNDRFEAAYSTERRLAKSFGIFALLAVFIACLGLFGLATFMAQNRTREIGIRKVMGATSAAIVGLLSRDFLKLVVVALVVAIPMAILLGTKWLESFPYRISIGQGAVVATIFSVLLIAALAVGYQSIVAANSNPADALKHE